MVHIVMVYTVMAYTVMTSIVIAYILVACMGMASIVMGYIFMAYIVLARSRRRGQRPDRSRLGWPSIEYRSAGRSRPSGTAGLLFAHVCIIH